MKKREPETEPFVFSRKLVICKNSPCRKSCHCKGVGLYYSMTKLAMKLSIESLKTKNFKDIETVRLQLLK